MLPKDKKLVPKDLESNFCGLMFSITGGCQGFDRWLVQGLLNPNVEASNEIEA